MNNQVFSAEEIDVIRLKDIIAQLTDVIFILCQAKQLDSNVILNQLTNLSDDEQERIKSLFCKGEFSD